MSQEAYPCQSLGPFFFFLQMPPLPEGAAFFNFIELDQEQAIQDDAFS